MACKTGWSSNNLSNNLSAGAALYNDRLLIVGSRLRIFCDSLVHLDNKSMAHMAQTGQTYVFQASKLHVGRQCAVLHFASRHRRAWCLAVTCAAANGAAVAAPKRPKYIPGRIDDPSYVRIFDTTLRDGEQSPGATLSSKEKLEIAKQLAKLGVDIIEAGFPVASPDDFEAVRKIALDVGNTKDTDGYVPVICGLSRTVTRCLVLLTCCVSRPSAPDYNRLQ